MSQLFLTVLDLSAKASILIIAVLLLRLLLKKAPRHLICLLWLLVGLRLVLPFSVESALSLIPNAAPVSSRVEMSVPYTEVIQQQEIILPDTQPVPDTDQPVYSTPVYTPQQTPTVPTITDPAPITPQPTPMSAEQIAAIVWLCGFAAFLLYLAFSYILLRRKVAGAIPVEEDVWKCPGLASPFVLGFVRPKIYLSGTVDAARSAYVLAHERAHIARRDHITKPLAFVILAVHWFNPLVWLAYILLCRDIELACDERVVKDMDLDRRKAYSLALLACSVRSNPLAACPLAFGEVGVKQRIKSVLSYKKPAFWVIVAAVICLIAASVFFLTDPKEDSDPPEDEISQNADDGTDPAPDADPSPDPTPVTTPQPDSTSAQLPDLPGFINADTMYLPYLYLNGDKENIVDIPYEYHAGLTAGAVEILTNGDLVKYTQEEFDARAAQLSGNNIVELCFSGRNISFILDELGYYIEYTVSAFTGTKVRFYAGDDGTLAAIENLLKDIPQVEYVYLDVDDPEEYALSNGLCLGLSYAQVKLILGESADVSYEHNEIGTMYCLNYKGLAKLYMFADSGGYGLEDLENSRLMFVQYYGANIETARGISPGDSWSQVYSAYGIERSAISGDRLPVGAAWSIPVNSRDTSVFALIPEDTAMWENSAPDCLFFLFEGDVLSSIYLRPAAAIDWQPTLTSPDFSIPAGTAYDPGLFYPLQVPMGTSIAADLDGDGLEELIYQNFNNIPAGDLFFTINGVDYSDIVDVHSLHRGSYYITDLEKTDGRLEITVYDEGPSGDPQVHFYQYADGELHYVGTIPYWFDQLRFDGDSYVLGAFRLTVLQHWYAGAAWRYADGQLQFIEQDFYHALDRETVFDWTTGQEIEHHYALCDMYVYASKNLSSQPLVLRAGTQFDLLGTDNVEWILLKTLDGEQYWLHAGLDNPAGITNSMDIIAGLDMSD